MTIGVLVGSLLPVFFVLALGYIAGKRHSFDADQAAGFSTLALSYALPATLFVSMTAIPRTLVLAQGPFLAALLIAHVGLFLVAWAIMHRFASLRGVASVIYALVLSVSSTPVFGMAVLGKIIGPAADASIGLVALAINLVVPLAVVLLEVADARRQTATSWATSANPVMTGLRMGVRSPLLWAPILGIAVALTGRPLPTVLGSAFELIGSTTSGVAIFAVGLVLAAHQFRLSRAVVLGSIGRVSVQPTLLFGLIELFHISGSFVQVAFICTSLPVATAVVLFASRYKAAQAESASILLVSTLLLAVTVPVTLWLTTALGFAGP